MPVVRIHDRNRLRLRIAVRQHLDQRPVEQIRHHHEQRRLDHPEPFQPAVHISIRIVDRDARIHPHLDRLAVDQEYPRHRAPALRRTEVHGVVPGEIGDLARLAVTGQIVGRRTRHASEHPDPARDHRRILERPHANHAVDPLLDRIDRPIGQPQIERDVRIALPEQRQRRNHEPPSERTGHVNAQHAGRLALLETRVRFRDFRQNLHAVLVVRGALRRQRQPPRRPVHQAHAEQRLEILDGRRDRRARHRERLRGAREAVRIDHARENFHCLDPVHAAPLRIANGTG
ncbi:hypothetical protein FEP07_04856 [Burkholderia multivorans]|nr:hypothetical protein [Burkholderia multivorans]MDR9270493.1 hypothetical protein [Burkholderia multivorans]MDR9344442.1 hypothetical protein [Burkholderia multivorans]